MQQIVTFWQLLFSPMTQMELCTGLVVRQLSQKYIVFCTAVHEKNLIVVFAY